MINPHIMGVLLLTLFAIHAIAQEQGVRLYEGSAPGTEDWKHQEQESRTNLWRTRVAFNVVNPTLTVFQRRARLRHEKTKPPQRPLGGTLRRLA